MTTNVLQYYHPGHSHIMQILVTTTTCLLVVLEHELAHRLHNAATLHRSHGNARQQRRKQEVVSRRHDRDVEPSRLQVVDDAQSTPAGAKNDHFLSLPRKRRSRRLFYILPAVVGTCVKGARRSRETFGKLSLLKTVCVYVAVMHVG